MGVWGGGGGGGRFMDVGERETIIPIILTEGDY